ncbi:hypothetical protein QCA50_015881 [Cerrena zonata]|uniref:DUF1279 domain-containing protein n=1 Tax=Cerrena zonata TaxID=2478898 RepID=A0AAW0FNA7_9APHY
MILGRLVPFAAVVSAGIANVFLMRSEELKKGITVFDEDGEDKGTSKTAALYAVGETAASRVINATPIMVVPPLLLVKLQKTRLLKAVFPQRQQIGVTSLEEKFHNLKDKDGKKIEYLEFNRGI